MLRLSSALAVATALAATAVSQTRPWTHQAPFPSAGDIAGVHMMSPTELWAACAGGPNGAAGVGFLAHTTDAGQTWERYYLGGGTALWDVFFLDPQHGWAAGNGFFRTTDGGRSWENNSTRMGSVSELFFLDLQHGWAAGNGGVVYRTTDGGVTWGRSNVGNIYTLGDIWFVDTQTGWTVNGNGEIYKSTDGGRTWGLNYSLGQPFLSNVRFFDPLEGWAIGGDVFLHTTDGGATWQRVAVPQGTWTSRAFFLDRQRGWAVGSGDLVRTVDGGQTWQAYPDGSAHWLDGVHFIDERIGVLTGETGVVRMTTDGGQTWFSLQSGGKGTTWAIDAIDAQYAWAGQSGGEILLTVDGGAFWDRIPVNGFNTYGAITGIDFVDPNTGWAIGDQSGFAVATSARIVRSTDGGRTWDVKLTRNDVFTTTIEAIDSQRAFAYGYVPFCCDFLWRTTNGGATWQNVSPGGIAEAIEFVDARTGWVAGGAIKKTTNAGETWVTQYAPQYTIEDISFADPLNGWAVGFFGTLLHTSNGGATWTPQSAGTGTSITFTEVEAISPTTAWVFGSEGYAARTTDGGQTWTKEIVASGINHYFTAARFLDAERGWVGTQDIPPAGGIWFRSGPQLSPYVNLGFSLQGPLGIAALDGAGPLTGGTPATVTLTNAMPDVPVAMVIGTTRINQIISGVMLVPSPQLVLPMRTDALGQLSLSWVWPLGIPRGTTLYFQGWIADGISVGGYSVSTALEAPGQ